MRFNDFKDKVSRFLELNYKFEMKNGFMIKNYKDFQLVIYIVKSSLGKHYKILSNFYVPEFHSYKSTYEDVWNAELLCEKCFYKDEKKAIIMYTYLQQMTMLELQIVFQDVVQSI